MLSARPPPLFIARANVSAEDALVHASRYLRCASASVAQVVERADGLGREHAWIVQHSLKLAQVLIDSLIDGIELQRLPRLSLRSAAQQP
ncbi:DUF6124 family protein [Pseudomonas sp.]|jgi:hypothetical protein|uniref:DUF6124 family protein n=1 Tax=Pseudomonas sp. TaxID=306 RepID=UPI003FA6D8CF